MSAIEQCRSAALGGHVLRCDACEQVQIAYNSCRNRHCPKCQARAARRWLEARQADLLPVDYYHVVFTLPAPISAIAYYQQGGDLRPAVRGRRGDAAHHRRRPQASRRADRRDAGPAYLGLGADAPSACARHRSRRWPLRRRRTLGRAADPGFFLPVRVLSRLFRRRFLEELEQAHRAGRLQFFGEYAALADARAFADWLAPLRACEWVVYAKRPFAGPAAVLAYLSRYTHRVAISNQRLLALDERGVTFRWKDYRAKGKTRYKTMTLGADEFMRRFLLHVLPGGFHRIRHYGLLANAGRREHLARARELLHVVPAATEPQPTEPPSANVQPTFVCPHCGAAMIIVETFARGQPIRAPPTLRAAA